jgi:hypothetical protein
MEGLLGNVNNDNCDVIVSTGFFGGCDQTGCGNFAGFMLQVLGNALVFEFFGQAIATQ